MIVNVGYAKRAYEAYAAAGEDRVKLCIIEDGEHGFKGAHDEKAIEELTAFARRP